MSFWQWAQIGGDYFLAVCGVVTAVCIAVNWLYKIWRKARKPHDDLKARVEELAGAHDEYDEYFKNDNERLTGIEADMKLSLTAIMQLITHEIDGNHVDKLRNVRDDIHNHLIERTR